MHDWRTAPVVLTDGGIETRLIYEFGCPLPEFASFLPLFDPHARPALETIYRSYLAIAAETGLAMQIGTPTWRAHPDCVARLGFELEAVNRMAVGFLRQMRREMGLEEQVCIAGVIGPRRDGYDPHGAPDAAAAQAYHRAQARVLAECGVDLLYAPTFASAAELRGVAAAMAETGLPYALAPVIDAAGNLLDGTPATDAIAAISPGPMHVLAGCVHPTLFRAAGQHGPLPFAGLKANASTLPPEELDKLDHLDAQAAEDFADAMLALRRDYRLRVLGGCCGTDDRHIRAIARRLVAE
jgi:S-methylmethionine-dependent homocysteine/selenocysteine methylase